MSAVECWQQQVGVSHGASRVVISVAPTQPLEWLRGMDLWAYDQMHRVILDDAAISHADAVEAGAELSAVAAQAAAAFQAWQEGGQAMVDARYQHTIKVRLCLTNVYDNTHAMCYTCHDDFYLYTVFRSTVLHCVSFALGFTSTAFCLHRRTTRKPWLTTTGVKTCTRRTSQRFSRDVRTVTTQSRRA